MNYKKSSLIWGRRIYTRKDRRAHYAAELGYGACFHYESRLALVKPIRKTANRKLRRYKGDISDFGWYKKFYDVWWEAF